MARIFDEVISDLPLDQQRDIAERTAQRIEEEMTPYWLRVFLFLAREEQREEAGFEEMQC
jgi:hypothetical protein